MKEENILKKIIEGFSICLFYFLALASGFAFLVMGTFLLPQIHNQLIELGRNSLMIRIVMFIIPGGIAGGSIFISMCSIEFVNKIFKKEKKCQ